MNKKRLIAAKIFMLSWMRPATIYNPGDFDEIVGGGGFSFTGPTWNNSIFCDALTILIKEKKVYYWRLENGIHCYKLNDGKGCPKTLFKLPEPKEKLTIEEQKVATGIFLKEMDEAYENLKNANEQQKKTWQLNEYTPWH